MTLIESQTDCIFCGRRLVRSGYTVSCSERWGPRPRSDEHIIPKCIGGKLVTRDVCKCCNEGFSGAIDNAFKSDERFLTAAEVAGIDRWKLLGEFNGYQRTASGRVLQMTKKADGSVKIRPSLRPGSKLAIGVTNGVTDPQDKVNLTRMMVRQVQAKGLKLSPDEIERRVTKLYEDAKLLGRKTYDPEIGEGFQPHPVLPETTVPRDFDPWQSERCLAKIVYELCATQIEMPYRGYFGPVLKQLHTFLGSREEDRVRDANCDGLFKFSRRLSERPNQEYRIIGKFTHDCFLVELVFFGTAEWIYERARLPPFPFKFEIGFAVVNPVEKDVPVTVENWRQQM